ncbi:MAG: hypothetical protein AMJ69_07765 [Gammaproteobacteria bacterium SG8_47]|nr:MAG: hypothetical protein AMJ69_07765 [Gammaproteobacteria bacterium SG8_47]
MPTSERGRLLWQCRRGMLELDIALQTFVAREFDNLTPSQREQFSELLQCPDDMLWSYLFGGVVPVDDSTADLIERIKTSAGP